MRIETKKVMVYVCMAQVTEEACQKGEECVDTLQAAERIFVLISVFISKIAIWSGIHYNLIVLVFFNIPAWY